MIEEVNTAPEPTTLSTGKYTIELTNGPSNVFVFDEEGNKQWVCSTTDPERAMSIVEGLVLVEMKRFYYPESAPTVNADQEDKPVPPFLRKD